MTFISGFLALCTTAGGGAATEVSGSGYARQAVSFSNPASGVSKLAQPFTFGDPAINGPLAGHALYDAPTDGNLLLVMPFPASQPIPFAGPVDAGDVGSITLVLTALATFPSAEAFSGTFGAAAVLGAVYDAAGVIGTFNSSNGFDSSVTLLPQPGGQQLAVHAGQLTAGVALTIASGRLRATAVSP